MAEHIWTVLCGKRLIDPDGQTVSLIDVGESVFVEGLDRLLEEAAKQDKQGTLINVPSVLVSWWHRGDPTEEALTVRFVMVRPDGSEMPMQEVSLPWEGDKFMFRRIFLNVAKLPVAMPGLHWFAVQQPKPSKSKSPRWATVTRIPLLIDNA